MANAIRADDSMVDKERVNFIQALQKLVQRTNESHRATQTELEQVKRRFEELARENAQLRSGVDELTKQNAMLRTAQSAPVSGGYPTHATNAGDNVAVDGSGDVSDLFQLVNDIQVHEQNVHDVAVHQKANVMATASWDSTVQLYDLAQRKVVRTLGSTNDTWKPECSMGGLYCVAFAHTQDDILGCSSADNKVYIWNYKEGRMYKALESHTDEVNGLDFHFSKPVLCSVSDDTKAIVWDYLEGIPLRVLEQHSKAVYGTKFLGPTFEYNVATCCFDTETRIFDMRDKTVSQVLKGHTDDVIGIDIVGGNTRTDAYLLATGSDDGHILVWDIRKWQQVYDFDTNAYFGRSKENTTEVKRVKFSPCGKYLAAGTSRGSVLVYKIGGAEKNWPAANLQHTSPTGKVECVFGVDWGKWPNGQTFLVSGSHDCICGHWNMCDGNK